MGSWKDTSPEVYQALKIQKAALDRHTPNKAAAAELIGVRPSTVDKWCRMDQLNPNMPLALVSRHPAARELMEVHAHQIGYTLVPLPKGHKPNGDVDDELRTCMVNLGRTSEEIETALKDVMTPGRVDPREAKEIMVQVRQLQKGVSQMINELAAIDQGEVG